MFGFADLQYNLANGPVIATNLNAPINPPVSVLAYGARWDNFESAPITFRNAAPWQA